MSTDRHLRSRPQRRHLRIDPLAWAIAVALAPAAVGALPQGGVVQQGQATIQTPQTGLMEIKQSSQTAAVDWRSFSVDKGETVQIFQPNAQSLLINRVIGYDPTRILGQINANGRVVLSNPRGVYFATGSQVDVGSLVATTLSISDADLQSGRLRFGASTEGAGELRAEGSIRAADTAALIAPQLTVNGSIDARRVGLAAASNVTVDVEGDGLVLFNVRNDDGLETRLSQLGQINASQSAELRAVARAGFADTVLNMQGVVRARSLEGVAGRVVADGGSQGVTWVNGSIDASGGTGHAGGDVLVQGQRIMLDAGAQLDVSGGTGGGRIRVGGDFHGANAEVRNAEMLVARPGSSIKADATVAGHGGQVVLWSDQTTRFFGDLSARGGPQGGDGGKAEVSGKQTLEFRGGANLGSVTGRNGTLLLDPDDITIQTGGSPIAGDLGFATGSGTITVDAGTGTGGLGKLLESTDVILQAKNSITVNNAVNGSGGSGLGSLTLQAGGDIDVNAAITAKGITLSANDPAGSAQSPQGRVTLDGNLNAGGSAISISNNGSSQANRVRATLTTTSAINLNGDTSFDTNGVLNAANVNLSGGTVALSGSASVATSAAVDVAGTATLTLPNADVVFGSLSGAGVVTLNNFDTLTVGAAGSTEFSGKLTGGNSSSTVIKAGAGTTWTLSGSTNDYTSQTQVNAGTLRVTGLGVAGTGTIALGARTLDLAGGASVSNTVTVTNGASITNSSGAGTLAGGGSFDIPTGATVNLSSAGTGLIVSRGITDTGTGSVNISGGAVTFSADNGYTGTTTIASGSSLNVGGGTGSGTLGSGSVTNNGTLIVDRSNAITIANAISGSGALDKQGNNTLTLTGNNSYSGTTNIAASGSLNLGGGGGAGTLGTGAVTNDGTLIVNRNNAVTIANPISGTGVLSKQGNNTLTLTGDNTYTGATTIAATGTLNVGGGGATGTLGTGAVTNGGTLILDRSNALTVAANIGGSGNLVKQATGTASLTGTSNYSGGTAINAGTLQLGAGGATGAIALSNVTGSGTLAFNRSDDVVVSDALGGSLNLAQIGPSTLTLTATNTYSGTTSIASGATLAVGDSGATGTLGGGAVTNNGTLTINRNNAITLGNAISGNGSLNKQGNNTLTLTGSNSYSGTTTIASGGSVNIGGGGGTGTLGTGAVTNDGTLIVARNNAITLANDIGGSGALDKQGNNTLTLTGNNTYGGTTAIAATGTLNIGGGGATGTLGLDTVTNGGTLVINRNNAITIANTINGSGALTKEGSNTLTLTGNNSYGGITTVSDGTLVLGDGGATGKLGSGSVSGTGTLAFNRNNDFTFANFINSIGTLSQRGSGTVTLTNSSTLNFTTIASGATLKVENDAALGASQVTNDGTLVLNLSSAATLSNRIIGGGDLVQQGVGTVSLTGPNNYSGTTTIDAGRTLNVGGGSASGALGTGAVSNSGTLTLDRSNALTVGAVISGTGNLVKQGAGTTTLTGNNNYSGGTAINNGTLQLGSGGSTGAITLSNVTGSGTLAFNRSNNVTVSDAFGSSLKLAQVGPGTLTLTGANTYSGTTTIASGAILAVGSGTTTGTLGTGAVTNDGTLVINRSDAITLANAISGGGALDKQGSNTLTLTGSNSYGGTTTIAAGGTLAVGDGGTAGTLGSGAVTNAGTLAVNRSDAVTLTNAIGGSGALDKQGSNTLTLTGTNTYSGTTSIAAGGTLNVGGGGTTGTLGTGAVTNDGTLTLDRSNALTVAAAIGGAGNLVKQAAGTTSLTGTNSYTGTTVISNGTLSVGDGGTTGSLGSGLLSGTGTLAFNRSDALTVSTAIASDLSLAQLGSGALTLTGSNTYSGNTTVASGSTLNVGNGGSTGTLGASSVFNDGTLVFNRSSALTLANAIGGIGDLVQQGTGTLSITGPNTYSGSTSIAAGSTLSVGTGASGRLGSGAVLNDGTLVINTSTFLILANDISGAGAMVKLGSNQVNLAGNNTYSGGTTLDGELFVGNGGTTGSLGSGAVVNNGTLWINRSDSLTLANDISGTGGLKKLSTPTTLTLTGNNSYAGTTDITGTLQIGNGGTTGTLGTGNVNNTGTLVLNRSDALNIASAISGAGNLVKQGAGTTVLISTNAYTGTTTINDGTLQVGNGGTAGTLGSGAVTNNATLAIHRSDAITLANAISGSGALDKQGSNTLTLTGGNAYTGTTTIAAGGSLDIGGGGTTGTLGSGAVINNGTLILDRSNALTVTNNIGGSGDLVKQAAGTTSLTGTNSYTGTTAVNVGTLSIGNGGTTGTLGSGALTGSGTLAFNRSDALTVATDIGSGLSLAQLGSNTLTLTGANTYTGTTSIASGSMLAVGNGSTTGTLGSGTVTNSGTLVMNRSDAVTLTNDIAGTGAFSKLGSNTLTLTGTNTYTGTTTIAAGGTLQMGAGGTTGSLGAGGITNNGTLTVNRSDAVTVANAISGTGALSKLGSNTLTLTGANTYAGATTIAAGGTLAVGDGGTTGTLGNGAVTNNGTLVLNRSSALTVANNISGTGNVVKEATGTTTLSGTNTYTGGTTIAAGTLSVSGGAALADASTVMLANAASATLNIASSETIGSLNGGGTSGGNVTLASGQTLTVGSGNFAGTISGATGSLAKAGAGALTLSGANTYGGGTSIVTGLLTLGASGALGSGALNITGGTLDIGSFSNTVSGLTVENATVNGSTGVLTAPMQALNGGALVNAHLGGGDLITSGAVTLNSTSSATSVTVASGTLSLGAPNRLAVNSVTVASNAALKLGGDETVGSLTLLGTLDKTNASDTLNATTSGVGYTLQNGAVVNAALGAGTLSSDGTVALNGTSAATTVNINTGTLTLGAADRLDNGAAVSVATNATLKLGGSDTIDRLTLSGTLDKTGAADILTAAATSGVGYTLHDGAVVNAALGTGTLASDGTTVTVSAPVAATAVNVVTGRLTLGGADLLADGATVNVSTPGVLKLGGNDTISQLNLSGQLESAGNFTLSATAPAGYNLNGGITLAGAHLGAGTLVTTGTGASILNSNTAATVLTVGAASTLVLAAPDNRLTGIPAITVNDNGTLTLQGNNTAASINLRPGAQVNGPGQLSADSYVLDNAIYVGNLSGGTLTSRNTSVLNGKSLATSLTVETGSLTLSQADTFTKTPDVVINTGASLTLGGHEQFGSLAGAGELAMGGHTLQTGSTQSTRFDGVISGNGPSRLIKEGSTEFTLGGASTRTGLTEVRQGTLLLTGGDNRLAAGSSVLVDKGALTSPAPVLKIAGTQTLASLTVGAGTVDRTQATDMLSAGAYVLNDGALINANLGSGVLTSSGNVTLNGTAAATTVNVTSGTLSLGAADRLADTAAVTLARSATLNLGGGDTVGTFTTNGTLARTGANDKLTATTYALNDGAIIDAHLGGGALTSNDSVALNGTAGASSVKVVSGTLSLGSADRLADAAAVDIASGATLKLSGNDTVGALTSAGTLASTGTTDTLTAASYVLNANAVVNANLGAGALTSNDNVSLNGSAAASTVNVAKGTLSLGAADRLADTAAVSIASGATLRLNGNDSVASLSSAGTLAKTGASDTLTAANYALDNGAAISANLGSGTLDTTGAVLLSGNAGVQTLHVNGGTLQLNGSNQLGAAPATTLAAGATLALSGDQTLGSLAGAGAVTATGGTLTIGSRGSSQYDGSYSGTGQLRKEGSGTLTLSGSNTYTGLTTIAAGALQLGTGGTSGTVGTGAIANAGVLRANRSDALTLANAISGNGALEQTGSGTLVLTGNNSYSGPTTIAAGTLQVGAGGTQGSLGSGAVNNAGLLRWQRSDAVSLSQTVTGTGSVEQAGTGTLTLDTALQTTGVTLVSRGSLVTRGDERIANGSSVVVDAGATLRLGGNETLAALTSAGNVELSANLTSPGDVKVTGTLGLTGNGPQSLNVGRLEANNASNTLGSQPLSLAAQSVQLNAGDTAALKLGTVNLAADSALSAGTIALTSDVTLTGGTTTLVAVAAPAAYTPDVGKQAANGQPLAIADATINQDGSGLIRAAGGALALLAKGGGSILLRDGAANDLSGGISAISGTAGAAWNANATNNVAGQSRISLSADTLRVDGAGVDGDLIAIDAAKLSTAAGSVIRARLPYSPQLGFAVQLPGLTLALRDAAFTQTLSFGGPGDGNAIAVDVGSSAIPVPAGFITVLPKKPVALGATAIYVNGPPAGVGGYQLFYDGSGRSAEVPVVYNGAAPSTPEAQGSISATVAVSEGARKDRFEEAVRTENVAIRLRAGVIAEVGAGRPATIGKEGIRPPALCTPTVELGCAP